MFYILVFLCRIFTTTFNKSEQSNSKEKAETSISSDSHHMKGRNSRFKSEKGCELSQKEFGFVCIEYLKGVIFKSNVLPSDSSKKKELDKRLTDTIQKFLTELINIVCKEYDKKEILLNSIPEKISEIICCSNTTSIKYDILSNYGWRKLIENMKIRFAIEIEFLHKQKSLPSDQLNSLFEYMIFLLREEFYYIDSFFESKTDENSDHERKGKVCDALFDLQIFFFNKQWKFCHTKIKLAMRKAFF